MEQRDYAVEYGAGMALTLVCHGGRLEFPRAGAGPPRELGRVAARLGPADGDAVITAVSDGGLAAELSALNAALRTMAAGSGYARMGVSPPSPPHSP